MKIELYDLDHRRAEAFTITEVLIAVGILGVALVSLYAGFSVGFSMVQLTRENLRATQILQEKMETIRLYNWDQINTAGFVPTNFTEAFYPAGGTNDGGITYTGSVSIVTAPVTESYSNELRQVFVNLQWVSSGVLRQREMTTLVSRYGLQNYIY